MPKYDALTEAEKRRLMNSNYAGAGYATVATKTQERVVVCLAACEGYSTEALTEAAAGRAKLVIGGYWSCGEDEPHPLSCLCADEEMGIANRKVDWQTGPVPEYDDGHPIIAVLREDCGLEHLGDPVFLCVWSSKLKTTVEAIRVDREQVLKWIDAADFDQRKAEPETLFDRGVEQREDGWADSSGPPPAAIDVDLIKQDVEIIEAWGKIRVSAADNKWSIVKAAIDRMPEHLRALLEAVEKQ